MYPIITISREYGSCGRSIAQAVARALDIPFYDRDILNEVAEKSGYTDEFVAEHGEYTAGHSWFYDVSQIRRAAPKEKSGLTRRTVSTAHAPARNASPEDALFRIQKRVVLELAQKGPCVIVGRCADYCLEQAEIPSMNVFIHAALPFRKEVAVSRYGEDPDGIEHTLSRKDKGRRTYYSYYTDREWGDYHNYQLNLDSSFLGEDRCAEIIADAAKRKASEG